MATYGINRLQWVKSCLLYFAGYYSYIMVQPASIFCMVQQFSKKNRPTESHSDRKYIGVSRYCDSLIRFIAAKIHGHICTVRWKWYMAITQESVCEKLCGLHTDIKRLINWTWNMLHFFTGWFCPYCINPSGPKAWIYPGHLGTMTVNSLDPCMTMCPFY